MSFYIAPSLMCVDMMNVEKSIRELEKLKADYFHLDIMDNHFVPNLMLPSIFATDLRKITNVPLDIHLMVDDPSSLLKEIIGKNPNPEDIISVHYESTPHIQRVLGQIKTFGVKAGIAICPATPIIVLEDLLPSIDMILLMTVNPGFSGQLLVPGMIEKIHRTKKLLIEKDRDDIMIEVDGNVSFTNIPQMYANGADIFVVGTSSIFNADDSVENNYSKIIKFVDETDRII